MRVINASNVREAYVLGMDHAHTHGVPEQTRNGPALVVPWPVVTVYQRPWERVLVDPARDANPFFHLMEAFWMLAGRRDVASLMHYNAGMVKYSDDGASFHGAYGHRWRHHFGTDQLVRIIELLRTNPDDRRIVLQMWDTRVDLGQQGLDFPCNNLCYFRQSAQGELDMTIVCRSNDALFGAYGANAVHFSVLHEFIAAMVGMTMGKMHQLSNNLHLYSETASRAGTPALYTGYTEQTTPLFWPMPDADPRAVLADIERLWDDHHPDRTSAHLPHSTDLLIAGMREAWAGWKGKHWDCFCSGTSYIPHEDWARACIEWGDRRREKFR